MFERTLPFVETVNGGYDELAFIEYYLNVSHKVNNGNKLIERLFEFGKTDSRPEQWHSLLAEFAAFYLLHKKYGLDVYGYETSQNRDFAVRDKGVDVHFEVKDRCGTVVQEIPARLKKLLGDLEKTQGRYRIAPRFIDKNLKYNCLNDPEVLAKLRMLSENTSTITGVAFQ